VRAQQVDAFQGESGTGGESLDVFHGRQPTAGKNLGANELHELQIADRELDVVLAEEFLGVSQNRVQQHPAVTGQDRIGPLEEQRVALHFEGLERADADDAVDGFVENLVAAVAIVVVVLLFFMGIRSGLIIGAAGLLAFAWWSGRNAAGKAAGGGAGSIQEPAGFYS
jgi:hypothetical protein